MAPAVRHQRVEVVQAGEGEARNQCLNDDLARDGVCVNFCLPVSMLKVGSTSCCSQESAEEPRQCLCRKSQNEMLHRETK